jgi:hypothetical protein
VATTTDHPRFHDPEPLPGGLSVAGRIGLGLIVVAALAGAVVFAVNRGHTSHPSTPGSRTTNAGHPGAVPSPTVTATTPATTPQQATSAEVLTAYRTEEAAFFAVLDHYPVDPSDSRLATTMVGPRLTAVENAFRVERIEDHYGVGTADLAPVVTSVDGTTASITDCAFDWSRIVNPAGATVSGPDTERTLTRVTLQLTGDIWKVSGFVPVGAGCLPAAH